jgi:hypothetical protein
VSGTRRAHRLSAEQESAIRALAATRSLHALAVEFDASHETVRAVIHRECETTA